MTWKRTTLGLLATCAVLASLALASGADSWMNLLNFVFSWF